MRKFAARTLVLLSVLTVVVVLAAPTNAATTPGKVALTVFAFFVLSVAVRIRRKRPVARHSRKATAPVPSSRRRPKIDLNPPMPKPVADEDMPIERIERRRQENKAAHIEADRIRAEERARVEAERPELTEDRIADLLEHHYTEVLATPEGREFLRKLISEAENAS